MFELTPSARKMAPIAGLFIVATLPFSRLLRGDWVYDDTLYLAIHPNLNTVRTLWDALHFKIKAARPVADFITALAICFWGSEPFAQRLTSILVHASVVLLAFANLKILCRRLSAEPAEWIAVLTCLVFAIHPLNCETLSVAQFRGEILATLFTLVAALAAQYLAVGKAGSTPYLLFGLFTSLGLAVLSQETFAVTAPATVLVFYYLASPRPGRSPVSFGGKSLPFWLVTFVLSIPWWGLSAFLSIRGAASKFSYNAAVGLGVITPVSQLRLTARAIAEGGLKLLTGGDLTSLRMMERGGVLENISAIGAAILLLALAVLAIALARRGAWYRVWLTAAIAGYGTYVAVPNINIGSEHYWYFSTLALVAILVYGVFKIFDRLRLPHTRFIAVLAITSYGLILAFQMQSRLFDLRSNLDLAIAEVNAHPEDVVAWTNAALNILLDPTIPLEKAEPYIQTAKQRFPNDFRVSSAEFEYYRRKGDFASAERSLKAIPVRRFAGTEGAMGVALMYLDFAGLAVNHGFCWKAEEGYRIARLLDRAQPAIAKWGDFFSDRALMKNPLCKNDPSFQENKLAK